MLDNQVTRYQNGFNNTRDTETFSDLPLEDRTKLHYYFDDFDYYFGPVAAGTTNGYALTGTGATAAIAALDGGAITISGATTGFIAAWQRTQGNFKTELGKRTWFGALLKIDTLANSEQIIAGLTNVTGTPFTAGQITDGIWFSSDTSGNGNLSLNIAVGSVVTTVALGVTLVANQFATLRAYWDGGLYSVPAGQIIWEASGAGVSSNVRGVVNAPVNFPGATLLAPQIAIKATAGTPTLTLSQLLAAKDFVSPLATPAF